MTNQDIKLKKKWYMVQYKNPNTKRWNDYAGLYNIIDALKKIDECREYSLLEWRLKEHKLVVKC